MAKQAREGGKNKALQYWFGASLMWQDGSGSSSVCEVSGHRRTSHLNLGFCDWILFTGGEELVESFDWKSDMKLIIWMLCGEVSRQQE